jgi:PAP2 superfamily
MKSINRSAGKRTLGLCMLMATLVSRPVVAKADAVLDWNSIAVDTTAPSGPFGQARFVTIVQLAVFEAVNSITHDYRPYLGSIVAPHGASVDAAVVQAAYRVLITYFPGASSLGTARANSLALIPDGQAKSDGIATGDAAALAMIALRANDGSSPAQFKIPGPAAPGEWQATPSCPIMNGIGVGVFLQWGNVTPFGIKSVSEFLLDPPPALDSNQYAKAYNEVKTVGSASANSTDRPPDRANVVLFYAASSPTFVFNLAARQVVSREGWHSLSENARAFALINMAIGDGSFASFFNKYHYNFWRPETAIHAGDTDGNRKTDADPNFIPFIAAPCFPSYPSNHGTLSNAGAQVLRRLYGEAGHAITMSNPAVPNIVLHYGSFKQITDDISDARIYGGIHFRFDQEAGARLGRAVGRAVYKNNLHAMHGNDHDDD